MGLKKEDIERIVGECAIRSSMRSPGLAVLLSFFCMGLGQVYNGQINKGIILLLLQCGLGVTTYHFAFDERYKAALAAATSYGFPETLLLVVGSVWFAMWVYNIRDAHHFASVSFLKAVPPEFGGFGLPMSESIGGVPMLGQDHGKAASGFGKGGPVESSGEGIQAESVPGARLDGVKDRGEGHDPSAPEQMQKLEAMSIAGTGNSAETTVHYAYGKIIFAGLLIFTAAGALGLFVGMSVQIRGNLETVRRAEENARRSPGERDAMVNLARAYEKAGNHDAANRSYRMAIAMNPDDIEAHLGLAAVLKEKGCSTEATAEFEKAAFLSSMRTGQGVTIEMNGSTVEGGGERGALSLAEDWLNAIRHDPRNSRAFYNLGILYMKAGLSGDAEYALSKARDLEPGNLAVLDALSKVLEKQGKLSEAVKVLEVMNDKRSSPEIAVKLASILEKLQNFPQAESVLRTLAAANSSDFDTLSKLSSLQMKMGRFDEAGATLKRLIELQPRDVQALERLAECLEGLGDRKGQIAALEGVIKLNPDHGPALSKLGTMYLESDDLARARDVLEKLALLNTHSTEVFRRLREVYRRSGDVDSEAGALERALKISPSSLELLEDLGDIYVRTGRDYEAIVIFSKITAARPDDAEPIKILADLYRKVGDERNEIALLEKILVLSPNDSRTNARLVAIHDRHNDFAMVEKFYRRMVELNPKDPIALRNLAAHYERIGDLRAALAEYGKLLALLKPDESREVLERSTVCAARLGDDEAEEAGYEKLVALDPISTKYLKGLASVLRRTGQTSALITALERLRAIDPADTGSSRELASLYRATGETARELGVLEEVVSLTPEDIPVLSRVAELRLSIGQVDSAIVLMEKVLKSEPGSATALEVLRDAYSKTGNQAGLIRILETSLKRDPRNARLHMSMSRALKESGKRAEALGQAEMAWQLNPSDMEISNEFLTLCIEERDLDRMISVYESMLARKPGDLEVVASLATLHTEKGNRAKAMKYWQEVRRQDRYNTAANESLLDDAVSRSDTDFASEILRDLLEKNPDSAEYRFRMAKLLETAGTVELAMVEYARARELAPDSADIALAEAEAARKLGRYKEALAGFEAAAEADPKARVNPGKAMALAGLGRDAEAATAAAAAVTKSWKVLDRQTLQSLGEILLKAGNGPEARTAFEKMLTRWPQDAPASSGMVKALVASGKSDEAASFLKELLSRSEGTASAWKEYALLLKAEGATRKGNPGADYLKALTKWAALEAADPRPHTELGRHYLEAGSPGEALPPLIKATTLAPDSSEAWLLRARASMGASDNIQAIQSFEKYLTFEPSDPEALYGIGLCRMKTGDSTEALAAFSRAISMQPGHEPSLEGIGNIHFNEKNYAKAAEFFKKVVDANPSNFGPYFKLGMALKELGRTKEAKQMFLKLSELPETPEKLRHQAKSMADGLGN